MRAYFKRTVVAHCLLLAGGLAGCSAGEQDGVQFTGQTTMATMYGSSGGSGVSEAETSEASNSTDDPSASTTDTTDASTDTTDASTGTTDTTGTDTTDTTGTDTTDASTDTAGTDTTDASTDATGTDTTDASTDTTDASTDTTDASTGTTDASTDTTDASTDTTDASTDTTGGDGDGGTTGGGSMCGNGALESGEDCDDGNGSNNDGCSSTCTWESNCGSDNPHPAISCGGQASGNMNGAYSDVDAPVCGTTFAWQDRVYVYTAQTSGSVTATFTAQPDQGDGAIVVMEGSCHSQLCIASSLDSGDYHSVTWDAVAGLTYYIDLELPSLQPSFNFSLSCG